MMNLKLALNIALKTKKFKIFQMSLRNVNAAKVFFAEDEPKNYDVACRKKSSNANLPFFLQLGNLQPNMAVEWFR